MSNKRSMQKQISKYQKQLEDLVARGIDNPLHPEACAIRAKLKALYPSSEDKDCVQREIDRREKIRIARRELNMCRYN